MTQLSYIHLWNGWLHTLLLNVYFAPDLCSVYRMTLSRAVHIRNTVRRRFSFDHYHDICRQMQCFDLYLKVLCNSDKVVSRACRMHLCFILDVFFHTYIRYVSRQWIVIRVLLWNTIPDSEGANQHHFKVGHTDHHAHQHLSIYLLIF